MDTLVNVRVANVWIYPISRLSSSEGFFNYLQPFTIRIFVELLEVVRGKIICWSPEAVADLNDNQCHADWMAKLEMFSSSA